MNINQNDPPELISVKKSYITLIESFNDKETKKEQKINNYQLFLNSSLNYLKSTRKYPNQIPYTIFDATLKYLNLFNQDLKILIRILQVLNLSYDPTNRVQNFKIDKMKKLFEVMISTNLINFDKVQEEISKFFITITKSQNSIQDFLSKDGLLFYILDLILKNTYKDEWMINTFSRKIKDKLFKSTNSTDFCVYYSNIDPNTRRTDFLTLFFLNFSLKFDSFSVFSNIANEKGAFDKYIYFVSKLDPKSWEGYYEPLILFDGIVNHSFITSLFNSCLKIPKIQEKTFDMISKLFLSRQKLNQENLNNSFPLQRVITDFQLPLDIIIDFLLKLDKYQPDYIQFCLEPFMKKLIKLENIESSDPKKLYCSLLEIVYHQIRLNTNNEENFYFHLIWIGFLQTFVISLNPEILVVLIEKFKDFTSLVFKMTQLLLNMKTTRESSSNKNNLIFYNNNNNNLADDIFKSFINTSPYCDKADLNKQLNDFCCNYLQFNSNERNLKILLDFTIQNKAFNLINILLSTILNVKIGRSFLKAGGLEWLEKALQTNLINIEKYSMLLGNLVFNQRFEEVDLFFLDLQKKKYFDAVDKSEVHPLFTSNSEYIKQIVYGMNKSENKPIRVYSLFHFLDIPNDIDPYNAWMLGNHSMNLLIDQVKRKNKNNTIYDIPLIKVIGNRFLNIEHVDELLSTNPFNIRQFCDKDNYDHFPLYQFYRGSKDLTIEQQFHGISFWFKFTGEFKQNCSFFSTNHISFSIRNQNELVIYYLSSPTETIPKITNPIKGQEDKILAMNEIDPYDWNIVYIQKVEHLRSTTISIYINHYNRSNNYTHSKPFIFETKIPTHVKFQMASFRRFSGGLMFLGPSIRLFDQFDKNSLHHEQLFKLIRNCGPGYTNKLKNAPNIYLDSSTDILNTNNLVNLYNVNNETIYLATEINLPRKNVSVPSNCFLVPYFGFPYHFTSIQKMATTLFHYLKNPKTKEEFIEMLFSMIAINSITKVNSRMFWSILLDIIHEISTSNPSYITQQLIIIIIKEISYQKVYKYNNTILTRLLYNLKIWNSVDKEDLIQVIFDCFQDIDINGAIPDFSYFLSDLILKNPTNKEIIFTILNHHEKVPTAISNLANFLIFDNLKFFNKTEKDDDLLYKTESNNYDAEFMLKLKDTIISSISEYLDTTVKVVENYFSFKDMNTFLYLYLTNNKNNEELSCKILHLIYQISIKDPNYFEISHFIMINSIFLSSNKMILQDAFTLISGYPSLPSPEQQSIIGHNNNTLFLLIALAWSSFVLISHVELFELNGSININYYYKNCYDSFQYCMKYTGFIVNSKECLNLLTIWFPIAFKSILSIKNRINEFDSNDEIINWKDVYYFNNKNKERNIIEFLIGQVLDNFNVPVQTKLNTASNVNVFDENLNTKKLIDCYSNLLIETVFKIQSNSPKISSSSSIQFILFSSTSNDKTGIQLFDQIFSSFTLCAPFMDDFWIKNQSLQAVKLFIDSFLKKSNKNYCFIDRFFKYLSFILSKTTNDDEMLSITEKLLSNQFFSDNYSSEVDNILFQIFKKVKTDQPFIDIFEKNIKRFKKVIHNTKYTTSKDNIEHDGSIAWAFLFYTRFHNTNYYKSILKNFELIPQNDLSNFLNTLEKVDTEKGDLSQIIFPYMDTMRELYQTKTFINQKYFELISNEKNKMKQKFVDYMNQLKNSMDNSINLYTIRLIKNKKEIENQIKNLEISLFLFYEEKNWNKFMNELKLKSSILPLFNPSSYLLSSQCLPYQFPKILRPFTKLNEDENNFVEIFEKKFTINFEMDGLKNIKTIKMKQTASQSLNNLVDEINSTFLDDSEENIDKSKLDVYHCFKNHFEIQYGKIERCLNCNIELFNFLLVPSVLFIFKNSTLMLLTYAEITVLNNESKNQTIRLLNDQIKEPDFHQFVKLVFNQQFGQTTLFFSHIVIKLPITDIIKTSINLNSESKNNFYFLIWTFSSGHFALSIKNSHIDEIRKIFEKSAEIKYLNNFTEKSIPDLLLFQIKSNDIAIKNWINQIITNEELIFYLNGINGYSFASFNIFPIIPFIGKCEGQNIYQNIMMNYIKSSISEKVHDDENSQENHESIKEGEGVRSISEFHQEEFKLNQYDIRNFLEEKFHITNLQNQTKKERNFIADFNSIHTHQILNPKSIFSIKMNQIRTNNNTEKKQRKTPIFNSRKITFIYGCLFFLSQLETTLLNNFIIRISRESMTLQILRINFDSSSSSSGSDSQLKISNSFDKTFPYTEIYTKFDQIFSTARKINSSKDGLYIVVDFEIGMSRSYRVFYTKDENLSSQFSCPSKVVISSEVLIENGAKNRRRRKFNSLCTCSCISGAYSVAATRDGFERIVMWRVQACESTLCLPSSSDAPASQTFWATPAPIHRIMNVNKSNNKESESVGRMELKNSEVDEISNDDLNENDSRDNKRDNDGGGGEESGKSESVSGVETGKIEITSDTHIENLSPSTDFADEILSFKLDEECGLWVATRHRLLFYSLNADKIGELFLSSLKIGKEENKEDLTVTSIEVLSSPLNEPFAIVGFKCGELLLASPRYDLGEIETKRLNSPHKSSIVSISINKMNKNGFAVVDSSKVVSYWSNIESCNIHDKFCYTRFDKCAICKTNNAKYVCQSCNLGVCQNCYRLADSNNNNQNAKQLFVNRCLLCSSIEQFIYE